MFQSKISLCIMGKSFGFLALHKKRNKTLLLYTGLIDKFGNVLEKNDINDRKNLKNE